MAERFMDEQGIASARELSMLSDEEVEAVTTVGGLVELVDAKLAKG